MIEIDLEREFQQAEEGIGRVFQAKWFMKGKKQSDENALFEIRIGTNGRVGAVVKMSHMEILKKYSIHKLGGGYIGVV